MSMTDRTVPVNLGEALLELEEHDSPGQCPDCGSTMVVNEVCVECVESGRLIHEPGGWRRPKLTLLAVVRELLLLLPRELRDDWRVHQRAAAAKKARKAEKRGLGR